ncbi:Sigma-70, region 4 [Pedobacter westerhofensis]|uniref:Sigma-70, region 4 n=1 Tax=Pedobacter westerhofensis TaxID=425512 RepID=A0A521ERC5_9SPHI|nr:sigma factor-like helix-turn-helix DNA-binding protein [Pedobacter westerhofensis]SMO86488.1 Sigma-70, region 4 [Pedobacter westerhofensis]
MLKTDRQVLLESKPESIRSLYDKYAGTLLGYIFEIVKDSKLAEECLVHIFCELSAAFGAENARGPQNWSQLQRFARGRLEAFPGVSGKISAGVLAHNSYDQHLSALSQEQKKVFLDIYYHGKGLAKLAAELNKTEEFIRKTLKEAFAILRKSGEN